MNLKASLAFAMLLLTCAWAAWLFGSINWSGAQSNSGTSEEYAPDSAVISLTADAESVETSTRVYLQEVDRRSTMATSSKSETTDAGRSRDLFGGAGRPAAAPASDDADLEVKYLDTPKLVESPKPAFPTARFKLTGILLGPDPRAYVTDLSNNKSLSLRLGDKIDGGTVKTINENGVTVEGTFGAATLKRNP